MKASEAYERFLMKAERNSVNDGLSTDRGRFVQLFNEASHRYIEYCYEKKNEDDIRYIQSMLVDSEPISYSFHNENYYAFELPEDYFEFSNVYGKASKGDCYNTNIDLFEIKDFNKNIIISDEFTSPSFEYREAPFTISDNSVKVFTDNNFSVDNIILTYYRYPKKIKLQNPDNPESQFDDSFDLDFDDKVIDRIISAAVSGFDINNSSERWQLHNVFAKTEL